VVVVCDARLGSASYRAEFLGALAVAPTRWTDAAALAADAARFLAEPQVVEERA
jgi:hypothetical protein